MPKNAKGGKHKHMKKDSGERRIDINSMPTPDKYIGEPVYIGVVTGILGDCRFRVKQLMESGVGSVETTCWLRKSKARMGFVVSGSVVMYALRSYESNDTDKKGDIEYLYRPEEISILKQLCIIHQNYESLIDGKAGSGVGGDADISDSGFVMTTGDIDLEEI